MYISNTVLQPQLQTSIPKYAIETSHLADWQALQTMCQKGKLSLPFKTCLLQSSPFQCLSISKENNVLNVLGLSLSLSPSYGQQFLLVLLVIMTLKNYRFLDFAAPAIGACLSIPSPYFIQDAFLSVLETHLPSLFSGLSTTKEQFGTRLPKLFGQPLSKQSVIYTEKKTCSLFCSVQLFA